VDKGEGKRKMRGREREGGTLERRREKWKGRKGKGREE
jgi:hypothetical protein